MELIVHDVHHLQQRVARLEQRPTPSTSIVEVTDLLNKLNKLDPAKKRVVLIGWLEDLSVETRLVELPKLFKDTFRDFHPVDFGNHAKGPYTNRQISNVSWSFLRLILRRHFANLLCKHRLTWFLVTSKL